MTDESTISMLQGERARTERAIAQLQAMPQRFDRRRAIAQYIHRLAFIQSEIARLSR